jgi:hypothetical protein
MRTEEPAPLKPGRRAMQEQKQRLTGVKLLVAEDDPVIATDYAAML